MKSAEFFFDAEAGSLAKVIHELDEVRVVAVFCVSLEQLVRAKTGGGDSKEFRADVHEAAQKELLALEFRTIAEHSMEESACEAAGGAGDVTQILREW